MSILGRHDGGDQLQSGYETAPATERAFLCLKRQLDWNDSYELISPRMQRNGTSVWSIVCAYIPALIDSNISNLPLIFVSHTFVISFQFKNRPPTVTS